MLSIGKLAPGRQQYYLDTVAAGIEDYYTGAGEAPGRWIGGGSELLGLSGEVEAGDLHAVLDGRHPSTTEPLGRAPMSERSGYEPVAVDLLGPGVTAASHTRLRLQHFEGGGHRGVVSGSDLVDPLRARQPRGVDDVLRTKIGQRRAAGAVDGAT